MCISSALEWKGNEFLMGDSNKHSPENASLHSGIEINYKQEAWFKKKKKRKMKRIKATKPSIIVKARIKFVHALKKDAQHSHITPLWFNNPPIK